MTQTEITPLLAGHAPLDKEPQGTSILVWGGGTTVALAVGALCVTAAAPLPSQVELQTVQQRLPLTRASMTGTQDDLLFALVPPAKTPDRPKPKPPRLTTSRRAIAAVERLSGLLGVTEEEVADLGGFNRRSTSNWRRGQGVYPKTVRGLFELDALVTSLHDRLGGEEFEAWLSHVAPDADARLRAFGSSAARRTLLSQSRSLLFAPREVDEAEDLPDLPSETQAPSSQRRAFTESRGRSPRRV